jgi:hypothetical protein
MLADIEGPGLDKALAELRVFGDRVRGTELDVSDRPAMKRGKRSDQRSAVVRDNGGVGAGGRHRLDHRRQSSGMFTGKAKFLPRIEA